MPAAGLAELMWTVCPSLNDSIRFLFGIVLWGMLFISPIILIVTVAETEVLLSLGGYSAILLVILLLCWSASCFSQPKGRIVNTRRWTSPTARMDRYPNIFAIMTSPTETLLLFALALCAYSVSEEIRWPSIDESSVSGYAMRVLNTIAVIVAFLWIFIVSVPLAIHNEIKRKEVMSSSFYSNLAAMLSGCLFLPLIVGLLLPMNCGNGPVNNSTNTTTTTTTTNTTTNFVINSTDPYATEYVCWTNEHQSNVILNSELLLVVMLTNIAAAVHDKTSEQDTTITDVGLDVVWSNLFTAGTKLIQVVFVLAALMAVTVDRSQYMGQQVLVGSSVLLCAWLPTYFLCVKTCCYPLNQMMQRDGDDDKQHLILCSVPWLPYLRLFGFVSIGVTSIIMSSFSVSLEMLAGIEGAIIVLGILVSMIARCCHRQLRIEHLAEVGLTQAMKELVDLESDLFHHHAFDTDWSVKSKDDTSYQDAQARNVWKSRIQRITSARHLASALSEFETHVLCENIHPSFYESREDWHESLHDLQTFAENNNVNEYNAVKLLVRKFKTFLRAPPKMMVIMKLVKQRMAQTSMRQIPPQAVRRIMEFIGASSTKVLFDFDTRKFGKMEQYDSIDSPIPYPAHERFMHVTSYKFPRDIKSTWTNGVYKTFDRGYKLTYEQDNILPLAITTSEWRRVFQSSIVAIQKSESSLAMTWEVRSQYAKFMMLRIVFAISKVELIESIKFQKIRQRESLQRRDYVGSGESKKYDETKNDEAKNDETKNAMNAKDGGIASLFSLATKFGSALVDKAVGGKWQCESCTFLNEEIHLQCKMCTTAKPSISSIIEEGIKTTFVQKGKNINKKTTEDLAPEVHRAAVHWNTLLRDAGTSSNSRVIKRFLGAEIISQITTVDC